MSDRHTRSAAHEKESNGGLDGAVLGGLQRRNAIDAVRLRIGMAISLGMMQPGERLPAEKEVAKGLSVSPITARRALTRLAEEGVLVRRRGHNGGTFVANPPSAKALRELVVPAAEALEVHSLVDRRLLMECALAHFAALRATENQIQRLDELTQQMAVASSWSQYHQADKEFHHLVAAAAAMGRATAEYVKTLEQLYGYFIPYSLPHLHMSNQDHIDLVAALVARDSAAAVNLSHQHVGRLHQTMFMALLDASPAEE